MIKNIIDSLIFRIKNNHKTTIGGGVFGVVFAAVLGKLEEVSGCHFATAFMNVDWLQVIGYAVMQIHGAMVTDANKTVVDTKPK